MDPLYHVLNRGVDKRTIFLDDQDYYRFVHNLFAFNDQERVDSNFYHFNKFHDIGCREIEEQRPRKLLVQIHAFALMPNHYHLLVSPLVDKGASQFMKKINMGYAKYFNERYKRTGALFQGKYRSVPILGDPHFSYLPFYIHFNPLDLAQPAWRERNMRKKKAAKEFLKSYRWSSHLDYLGIENFPSLTHRDILLKFFGGTEGYARLFSQMLDDFSVEKISGAALE